MNNNKPSSLKNIPLNKKESFREDKTNPIVSKLLGTNPYDINIEKFRERKTLQNSNSLQFNLNGKLSKQLLKSVTGKFSLDTIFVLDLSNQNLTGLIHIDECVNLVFLNVSNNLLIDLKGIENLKEIIYLNAAQNSLSTLDPLRNCSKLSYLIIFGNLIKSSLLINVLSDLRHLKTLFLQNLKGELKNPVCDENNYRSIMFDTIKSLRRLDGLTKDLKKMDFGEEIKNVKTIKFENKFSNDYWFIKEFPKIEKNKIIEINSNEIALNEGIKSCKEMLEKCENKLKEFK